MKTKSIIWFCPFIVIGLILILTNSCNKEENILKIDYGTLIDIDGNSYKTVKIGTQEWLAENLRTTQYNDATAIPQVTNKIEWTELITPAYCWYNNDATNKAIYGALYNWYTINTNKLCPSGWHVPTDLEWDVLMDYLKDDAGKLKERGTTHWLSPNTRATNESGFSALPGGYRSGLVYDYYDFYNNKYVDGSLISGTFMGLQDSGYWWSSTQSSDTTALIRYIGYFDDILWNGNCLIKGPGFSVRCLKDN